MILKKMKNVALAMKYSILQADFLKSLLKLSDSSKDGFIRNVNKSRILYLNSKETYLYLKIPRNKSSSEVKP